MSHHGEESAEAFGEANERGITAVERLSTSLDIECEFERRNAFVFTKDHNKVDDMHREVEAATRVGLPASFERALDLPFEVVGAVRFSHQAQFHPRKFLLGLAEHFVSDGGVIYENTKATDIRLGNPNTVVT